MYTFDDIVLSAPKSIFILYLIVSGNYLANLFGCKTQRTFNNNMWLKHLLGFMTLYFFVVLVDSKSKWSDSPITQLFFTILFYTLFVMTTRIEYKYWVVFILGLCLFYILQVYKDHDKTKDEDRKKYEKYQKFVISLITIVGIVGFINYYNYEKQEYGKDFNLLTFILGKTKCAHDY